MDWMRICDLVRCEPFYICQNIFSNRASDETDLKNRNLNTKVTKWLHTKHEQQRRRRPRRLRQWNALCNWRRWMDEIINDGPIFIFRASKLVCNAKKIKTIFLAAPKQFLQTVLNHRWKHFGYVHVPIEILQAQRIFPNDVHNPTQYANDHAWPWQWRSLICFLAKIYKCTQHWF